MRKFEEIGKVMPFKESDIDVNNFIERITTDTILDADSRDERHIRRVTIFSMAASIALLCTIITLKLTTSRHSVYDAVINSESVAEVLNNMGDDAVEGEVYYTQNAMADYYY